MQWHAQECQQLPEAGRGKEQVSRRAFRGSAAMLTTDNLILDFRPPELWDAGNKFLLF